MADAGMVLARLQAALSVYDASWDVSAGSATYKILESVAQEISIANNNSVLQTYSYDVNTKSGQQLDVFCNLFGVYRQLGKRASGTVTFSTTGTTAALTVIPVGTQVAIPIGGNNGNPSSIYYATTSAAVITPGEVAVQVPVSAVLPGAGGNAPDNTITQMVGSIMNITGVTNNLPIIGGNDPESDSEFRNRWQNTAFNNTTGTYGKYVITALQDQNVNRATALGQQNYWDEQCQIAATVSGTGAVTFVLAAYSGMTNLLTGAAINATTVIASSGFSAATNGTTVAAGLTSLFSTYAPGSAVTVTASPATNTITSGFNLSLSSTAPYRLMIGSGANVPGSSVISSGVITISGTKYWEWIQSANPDVGTSGTMSYVNTQVTGVVGYSFPQGNELLGNNLNSSAQTLYANTSDYYYPSGQPSIPLTVTIANKSGNPDLFVGNTVEMVSEYCAAASRSTSLTNGNYVDVFIDGTTANSINEQSSLDMTNMVLTTGTANNYLNTARYVFANGATAASGAITANGDYYVWLNQQPAINFPSQLSVATSGIADQFSLYNLTTGSSMTVPITLNKYATITFTGTVTSGYTNTYAGTQFIPVANANLTLHPGLALASGVATSGNNYWITSVTTSGIYLNHAVTGVYNTTTSIAMSGKSLAYPLYDATDQRGSVNSMTALVLCSGSAPSGWSSLPTVGQQAYVNYQHDYNIDVTDVDGLVQQSRPVGTNVLVHQAAFINLVVNLTLVISTGSSQATVQSNIDSAISKYFAGFGYNQAVSFASIASSVIAAGNTLNVRVDSVSVVSIDGTVQSTQTSDFVLASNQLPTLYSVSYTYKGSTSF